MRAAPLRGGAATPAASFLLSLGFGGKEGR
jgi:hypothetical protein